MVNESLKNTKGQRVAWIDIARGGGILLMIVGHMPSIPTWIHIWIYSFHMPLFFILSGYLNKKTPITKYLKRSSSELLRPYAIFSIIFIALDYIIFREKKILMDSLWSFIIGRGGFVVLWFLFSLWIVKNLYNVIDNKINKRKTTVIIVLVLVGYILTLIKIGEQFMISSSLVALGLYAFGDSAKNWMRIEKINLISKLLLILLCFSANIILNQLNILLGGLTIDILSLEYGILPLTFTAAIAGCGWIIMLASITEKWVITKPFVYMGRNSLFFFIIPSYLPTTLVKAFEIRLYHSLGALGKILAKIVGFAFAAILSEINKRCNKIIKK